MKKALLICIIMIGTISSNLHAQHYSENKLSYDYKQYTPEYGDSYNPVVSGVCSFVLPGLGQMISGEILRGSLFTVGYAGSFTLWYYGYYQHFNGKNWGVAAMMFGGAAGMLGIQFWSIIDAVKVAKVNSMYNRNNYRRSSIDVEMSPYIDQIAINNQLSTPLGMTMRIKF
jgi:hypothetical protein